MGDLIYLTGPTRSGKSARAVEIAKGWGENVVFVATYGPTRRRRDGRAGAPASRRTAGDLAHARGPQRRRRGLAELSPAPSGVILDSVVIWTAARFERADDGDPGRMARPDANLARGAYPVLVVGDEIGWAPVPMDASLRRFRDLVGLLGQASRGRRRKLGWSSPAARCGSNSGGVRRILDPLRVLLAPVQIFGFSSHFWMKFHDWRWPLCGSVQAEQSLRVKPFLSANTLYGPGHS